MSAHLPDSGRLTNCLLFRPGSIGDAVVSIPAVTSLSKLYPAANFSALSNRAMNISTESAANVLVALTSVQSSLHYGASPAGLVQLWNALKRQKFDAVFYLGPEREPSVLRRYEIFFRLVGIPLRVGFATRPALVSDSLLVEHETNRILRWLGFPAVVSAQSPVPPQLVMAESSEPYFCFCAGGKVSENRWPVEKWYELFQRLSAVLPGFRAVGLGAAADYAITEQILAGWSGLVKNCCGTLSVSRSLETLHGAALMISHDTGPIHLAALASIPCLGIYGNRNPPGKWYPLVGDRIVLQSDSVCRGVSFERLAGQNVATAGTTAIEVERVVQGVIELIGAKEVVQ